MRKRKQTEWDIKQNLEWLEVADFSGFYYTCGLIHHNKKEVSPCHGYYYPNPMATQMMKYAKRIGQGRNPQKPGEVVKIPASKAPVFKAGKALKDAVNK